jgi:predicted HicB family RNase H-like nuclease
MSQNRNRAIRKAPDYKPEHYHYSVIWSEEDEAFIGRALEWPFLAAHGDTQETALREIRDAVQSAMDDCLDEGDPIPEPLTMRTYSGTLNVRMPKQLHRQLAIEAAQEGVSLNQLILSRLASE